MSKLKFFVQMGNYESRSAIRLPYAVHFGCSAILKLGLGLQTMITIIKKYLINENLWSAIHLGTFGKIDVA